jgi:small subunit ribosomal protein S9
LEVKKHYATGRRKSSVARVWLWPGEGNLVVNRKPLEQYFTLESWRADIAKPFEVTATTGKFDVFSTVKGGGITGQRGALRHGIARALEQVDAEFRSPLKKAGFVTRDPRVVERKKYGQPGARKRFQFSKR